MYLWKMCFTQIHCRLMVDHTLLCFWPSLNPSSPELMTYSLITCKHINQTEVTHSIVLQSLHESFERDAWSKWKYEEEIFKPSFGENKVSFNRAEKDTWIYYFILAFDSYCSAVFVFWACRILFINPERMVERRRTGEGLCFGLRSWHG